MDSSPVVVVVEVVTPVPQVVMVVVVEVVMDLITHPMLGPQQKMELHRLVVEEEVDLVP
jgi:hypothetical protein